MKYAIVIAALLAPSLAHAGFHHSGGGGTECVSHPEANGDVTTTCNPALGEWTYTFDNPPAPRYVAPRYWTDIFGDRHACDGLPVISFDNHC